MGAAAEMLSTIESMDSWLLKREHLWEENLEKLCSLLFEKADNKEKVYSLLVGMEDFCKPNDMICDSLPRLIYRVDVKEELSSIMGNQEDYGEDNRKKLRSLLVGIRDLPKANMANRYTLLVGMADFWDNNKERLYSFLIRVSKHENIYRFLFDMTDLWVWEDDDNPYKDKLHSFLADNPDLSGGLNGNDAKYSVIGLMMEMRNIWIREKGKLNKVKLCSWLLKMADLWEDEELLAMLLSMARCDPNPKTEEYYDNQRVLRKNVEAARKDLRLILDFMIDKKLEDHHYFVYDVLEMTDIVQPNIQLLTSDPSILILESFKFRIKADFVYKLLNVITFCRDCLRDTKECMLEFQVERASQNAGELKDIVGLEEDIESLLLQINEDDTRATTVYITGMTGIGKTTLARALYDDATAVDRFECRAWVCVRGLSRKETLIKLIRQLVGDDNVPLENKDNASLVNILFQHLRGMQYFIVLDDVADCTYWKDAFEAFPQSEGSRLLVTTCRSDVKWKRGSGEFVHTMKFLDDNKSWQLLLKTIFWGNSDDMKLPEHLEKKGRQMLRKCNGLPLAIKEVGRQWAIKRLEGSEWEEVFAESLMSTYYNLDPDEKLCLNLAHIKEDSTTVPEMLSTIESMDGWLLKKEHLWEENLEKLCSLLFKKADDNKEKLYSLLVGMEDVCKPNDMIYDSLPRFIYRVDVKEELSIIMENQEDYGEDNQKRLCSLLVGIQDLPKANKANRSTLLVGMADFWDNNKERLYSFLIRVSKHEDIYRFLFDMTDLWVWEDDDNPYKDRLRSFQVDNPDLSRGLNGNGDKDRLFGLMIEMRNIWTREKGKLNKVKLRSWLLKMADLWEDEELLAMLLSMARRDPNPEMEEYYSKQKVLRKNVEGTRKDLRLILDFMMEKKLEDHHYFVYDVLEMTDNAQSCIHFLTSDPSILILEMFEFHTKARFAFEFWNLITFCRDCLQDTKECMLEFRVKRASQNAEEVKDIVGLEEDIESLLLQYINDDDSRATAVYITGMTGIGKTTLARALYDDATTVDRFACRAWVCVRGLSRKEILIKLIRQLVGDDNMSLENKDNVSLVDILFQHLGEMKYFIVLDDVAERTYWKEAFKTFSKFEGSRLLVTTCRSDVTWKRESGEFVHTMKNLDADKSWQLLLKTVFCGIGDDKKLPEHLEKKGRQVLRKCNGLPLAIKEVGRQWANKRLQGSEWEEVLAESLDLCETLVALESTYYNLDADEKLCFLYLAHFKEDTTTRIRKLVDIVTIGLFSDFGKFEKSQQCLTKLLEVYVIEENECSAKTCRINAVFHRLSITKAEDEMNFEILRKDGNNRRSHEPHHRVIESSREVFNHSTNQDENLVSLFFHGGGYFDASPPYWKRFEKLKILDMEDFGLKILPDAVGMLRELGYLGLRNNYIQELPHSLRQLKRLEILDIALNFEVDVPDIIWEMDSLRRLFMSDIICKKPLRIDSLKNLETLTSISVDNWTYELSSLKMMTNLSELGIEELDVNSDVRKLFASLVDFEHLTHLSLRGFRSRSMPSWDELCILKNLRHLTLKGHLTKLPSSDNFPPNLRHLRLVNSCLDEDPMPTLGRLYYLEYLELRNAYIGQRMVISRDAFRVMCHLVIQELRNLRNLEVEGHALLSLDKLEINSCPYLETLPDQILSVGRLEGFKMVTTKNIAAKIRESSLISKIQHVDIQP